jgi:hypothetical protein
MSTLIASSISVTTLAGGAARVQILGGKQFTQWTICDYELTAAQNTSLQTALAAVSGTSTLIHQPGFESPLVGLSNAI